MAKIVTVNVIDDIDGTCAVETVVFSFDGKSYEIDLTSENADKLRSELMGWADKGRPVEKSARGGDADGQRPDRGRLDATAIRDWARRYGFEVCERGRLPRRVLEAYQSANQQPRAG